MRMTKEYINNLNFKFQLKRNVNQIMKIILNIITFKFYLLEAIKHNENNLEYVVIFIFYIITNFYRCMSTCKYI